MNTEKLSPFEGLRLVANAAKGYIAQQIATIAGTVEGIVNVISEEGTRKPVAEFVASFDGSQNCKRPSTILPVGVDSMCNAQVPEVIKVVFELKERKYCRNG